MSEITLQEKPFVLESGQSLPEVSLAYKTWGSLNKDRSNAVLIAHALTGSADANEWWSGIVGGGKLLDPNKYYIICVNALGSCYGSTGPESIDLRAGNRYKRTFPVITIRDIARSTLLALDALGIESLALAIGGSMGGMIVLELALLDPQRVKKIVTIAVGTTHSAWRIAFSSTIRRTIAQFAKDRGEEGLREGMKIGRALGMISYRSSEEFDARFSRERISDEPKDRFDERNQFEVERYLAHQGEKIAERFSPYSYLTLTRAMELYDLSQGRSSDVHNALAQIEAEALVIGISSDVLYPEKELREMASAIPHARYATLNAIFGHDSFLIATAELSKIIAPFLSKSVKSVSRPRLSPHVA